MPVVFYAPPTDGYVVDPFRPPAHPGAPGNRGLEYATRPGSAVRAAAAGIVTFAGQVGSGRHVTVAHADGVRTSYSFLAGVAVRAGQSVGAGDVLGTTGASFHFGARIGGAYVDPAVLLGIGGRARLVPMADRRVTGWFRAGGPPWRRTARGLGEPAHR
ncbi:MAG: M23 family metallopeptidase [bacterium]|nr:M23 family metallopeptidase [bacterium]